VDRFVGGDAVLVSHHPTSSLEEVRASTGWELRVANDVHVTETPSPEALRIIRDYDHDGFWTRRGE
jgi:glutaconate CoA-transferase subunit B